ncbi:conjugal transfer protein TrbJ [Caulobacter sp.]|uniref:conjugal transfer protein TrbJ n=1 Tax=Caulobacter sp. TaxID=78 RepID=UPI0031DEBE69
MIASRRRLFLFITAVLGAVPLAKARAQLIVEDPSAIAQAIKQVQQGLQQIQHLRDQVAQQARMLQSLGTDVTGPLGSIVSDATALMRQAQGLGYQAADLSRDFANLYPQDLAGLSPQALAQRLASWGQNSRATLEQAMQVQNQIVQAQPATAQAVGAAVAASQNAAGQTAAVQATNQLLMALSTQLTQLQTLLISQARQQQTWEAERQAVVSKSEADRQRNSVLTRSPPRFSGDILK